MDLLGSVREALAERYEVIRELGRGGMASVYLARDRRLDREVAVKVLRPEFSALVATERFLDEIRIAARFQHPNIVAVHDSGRADDRLYYVMPYIRGETLRQRLGRVRQLTVDDAIRIAKEVATALDYAHGQGMVHRDIKPENILLSDGHVYVADFGIAKAISAAGGDRRTETGVAVGTPEYMSPEQCSGEAVIDGRSDVYALACVVYEMLAGEPPFTGPTVQAVFARHRQERPPSLRIVRDTVSERVQATLETALAKVPADRFATAAAFASALEAARSEPVAAERPRGPLGTLTGRRPWVVWVAGVTGVAVLTALVLVASDRIEFVAKRSNEEPPTIVVLPFENLGLPQDAYFADGITDEITSRIARNGSLSVISRATAIHYSARETDLKQLGRELGVNYVLSGSIRTDRHPDGSGLVRVTPQLARVSDEHVIWSRPYDVALVPGEIVRAQSAIAEDLTDALDVKIWTPEGRTPAPRSTDNLQAYDYYLRGNLYAAQFLVEEATRRAVDMYEHAVGLDPGFALAFAKLGQSRSLLYYYFDRRPEQLALAKAAVDRALALDPELAESGIALGYYSYWGELNYDRALEEFTSAYRRQPNNAELLWLIGSVERRQGKWEPALASFTRAAKLDPRSHIFAFELAGTLVFLRRYAEAAPLYDRAIALAPKWVLAYGAKALSCVLDGRAEDARAVLREALSRADLMDEVIPGLVGEIFFRPLLAIADESYNAALERFSLATGKVDSGSYYLAKAALYERKGRSTPARGYYDSARVVWESRVRDRTGDFIPHIELGRVYAGLGRRDDAVKEAEAVRGLEPVTRDAFRGPVWAMQLARVYVAARAYGPAFDQLEALLHIPSVTSRAALRVDPDFEPVRTDPRFQKLVAGQ